MSDAVRQSNTDKAERALKPESTKSAWEKVEDATVKTLDQAAEKVQPDSQKSTTQSLTDAVTGRGSSTTKAENEVKDAANDAGNKAENAANAAGDKAEDAKNGGKGLVQQAQEAIGSAAQAVADTLSGDSTTGKKL